MDQEPADLNRALAAIRRTQHRFIGDLATVCQGDPRFLDAFRRWREWLTLLKLHLVRAEDRLLHYLLVPEERRPWREYPGNAPDQREVYRRWDRVITPYLASLRIDTTYLRLGSIRDPEGEPTVADIGTDLVAVATLAECTGHVLAASDERHPSPWLEDLAFFHVLAPWKVQGLTPLSDVLRWFDEFLGEMDEV